MLLIYLSKRTIISTNSETAMLSLECVIRTLLKCSRFSKVSTIVHSVSLYAPNVLSLKIKNLCLLIQTKISLLLAGLVSNCFPLAEIHLLYYLFSFGLFDSLMLSFVLFFCFFVHVGWVSNCFPDAVIHLSHYIFGFCSFDFLILWFILFVCLLTLGEFQIAFPLQRYICNTIFLVFVI